MEAENTGKNIARFWRWVFWFIGLCGLISVILGIAENDIALIAGGILMIAVAPGSEFVSRRTSDRS